MEMLVLELMDNHKTIKEVVIQKVVALNWVDHLELLHRRRLLQLDKNKKRKEVDAADMPKELSIHKIYYVRLYKLSNQFVEFQFLPF